MSNGNPEDLNREDFKPIPDYGSDGSLFNFDPSDPNGDSEQTSIILPQETDDVNPSHESEHFAILPNTPIETPMPATAEQNTSQEGFIAEMGMFSMGKPGHENEDAIQASSDLVLCIADGVGSTPSARDAAYIATEVFTHHIELRRAEIETADDAQIKKIAMEGVGLITETFDHEQKNPNNPLHPKASTTFGAVILIPPSESKRDSAGRALAVGIGDSPVILVRDGKAEIITEEQTGKKDPSGITNWLAYKKGERQKTPADDQYKFIDLKPGDKIVLATDGLMGDKPKQRVPLEDIAATVTNNDDPQMAAYELAALPGRLEETGGKAYNPQTETRDIPFEAKNDDLTVGVIEIPEQGKANRRLSSDEIIAQQPKNERLSLKTLDNLLSGLGDKSQITLILDEMMPNSSDEVEEIKNYNYQGVGSADVMADLQNAIKSDDPDTQNIKNALLENPAEATQNLAVIRATLNYLIDLPLAEHDNAIGQSAEVYQRLKAVGGLLMAPVKEVNGNE